MKQKVNAGTVAVILVIVAALLGFVGWRMMGPGAGANQQSEETAFRQAEKQAKANGVDIRTIAQWAPLYYKYHPEETPPAGAAAGPSGAPTTALPPGAAAATPSGLPPGIAPGMTPGMAPGMAPGGAPGTAPGMTPGMAPGMAPGGR